MMILKQRLFFFSICAVVLIYVLFVFLGNLDAFSKSGDHKCLHTKSCFSEKNLRSLDGKDYFGYSNLPLVNKDSEMTCSRWAVVTTIFKASEAVRIVAREPSWCLVIVGDKQTPPKAEYLADIGPPVNKTVLFLSPDDQEKVFPLLSRVIPWNDFRRKNIGYMYAIKHGADMIWDFDDDNLNLLPLNILNTVSEVHRTSCSGLSFRLFNPYPYFSVNETYTWPRGFPMEYIQTASTVPNLCNSTKRKKIGVIQSLANIQPDVDAIYRFTRTTPFTFGATPSSETPILVPINAYSPFNAQATLWMKDAFRYLALPMSVTDRVSDIWRSYVAQFFLHKKALYLAFVPPYVDQHRNIHDNLKDFNDELDIYQKGNALLQFLSTNVRASSMLDLYQDMFERGYLEERDIHFITVWIKTYNAV